MATSAYSNYLTNPSAIPRMSGETEADALARVQGWHDAAVARTANSNQVRQQYNTLNAGAPNFTPMDMRNPGTPLPMDNYVSESGQPAESVMRLIGGSNYTPRTGAQTAAAPYSPYTQGGFTAGGGSVGAGSAAGPSGSSSQNASTPAIVEALRQKPNRYAGLGMGTSTNAVSPQAKSIDLDKTKTPSGLFQSV